ncbi:hypothetical protein A8C56_23155 [Niabella ginsenosidivorans]|uniref:OmpA-like domain-containing protein n=1 Tax=Niabella ginsenosidivorans TaxID=1176587 RepID=A0A1A9I735_9BACT|nr:hypothetical protein [Niabella ginsenosidivorans]ANH83488.1 hypothetical protein A8C56_23155 [Niabella ginsenosidivorans]
MKLYLFIFSLLLLASCGFQKQLATAKATSEKTKRMIQEEAARLDSVKVILNARAEDRTIDSVLNKGVQDILDKLNSRLNSVEQLALIIDAAARNRASFRKGIATKDILAKLILLDSFNNTQQRREEVYSMLNESVRLSKYKMFHLAAFFDRGVYRIPQSAMGTIISNFTPIVDSLSVIANKYAAIEREARIVFVGYSDNTRVAETGPLYKELTQILHKELPSQSELNQLLSDLRAKEMAQKVKIVLDTNASRFKNFNSLKIGYIAYGKGEEYPSPRIKDYKPTDERRRIVVCYWTVLPKISDL